MSDASNKRAAPEGAESNDAKRPAPATTCTWGAGTSTTSTGCSWGTGGSSGGCSWGSGTSTSFASVASSGTGFGALAAAGSGATGFGALAAAGSAAPATGFGAFSGATTFAPKPKGSEPAQAPAASVPSNECPTPSDEPPSTVEAAVTGEEDETCVHRVRAKVFRLEVRMEVVRKDEKHPDAPDLAEGGGGGGGDGAATAEADDAAKSDTATTAPATDAKRSSLNPNAKPFVPAGGGAAADAGAAAAGGEAGEAGKMRDEASKGAAAKDDEGGGGEEEDDEEDDNKPAAVPEDASGPLQEVTRWAERGVGQLRLLVHKSSVAAGGTGTGASVPFPRLVMRVEHVGRLILNEALLPSTAPAQKVSDTSIRLVVVSAAAAGPQSYLFRVKTPAEAAQLLDFINKTIPAEAK